MIIGINGFKESGKDTAFQFLEEEFSRERRVIRRAFADPLKVSVARSFGLIDETPEQCVEWCNKIKESGSFNISWDEIAESGNLIPVGMNVSGRNFLQWYGTEGHRGVFGYSFWVDHALPEFDGMGLEERTVFGVDPDEDFVIFTDARFPNEAERVRQNGGVIWEIVRPGQKSDGHASEVPLPRELVDVTIHNDEGLEEFRNKVIFQAELLLGYVVHV